MLVAGAGIGGLTAALALARAGVRVTVLERENLFEAVGAGIQVPPNASRILAHLDVLRWLQGGLQPEKLVIRRGRDARLLAEMPLGAVAEQRWGAPVLVAHRSDLQRALLEAVALSGDRISLLSGAALTGFGQGENGVTASIRQGAVKRTIEADGLVGADGLNSLVRARMEPGGGRKVFSGRTAWRALVAAADAPGFALARQTNLWLGKSAHLVHYPVCGGNMVNLVAIVSDHSRTDSAPDIWAQPGNGAVLMEKFDAWDAQAQSLLAAAPNWRIWPLFDRAALSSLGDGRVVLLGDAAHPMLPFLAQGSAQAIEDAAVLGSSFAASLGQGNIGQMVRRAFSSYSAARIGRTAHVQAASRRQGDIYHLGGPASVVRDLVLRHLSPEKLAARYDWLYGFRASL